MVRVQSELGAIEVGSEMYYSPYNSKTLSFVRRVVALRLVVAARSIGNDVLIVVLVMLAKYRTNT